MPVVGSNHDTGYPGMLKALKGRQHTLALQWTIRNDLVTKGILGCKSRYTDGKHFPLGEEAIEVIPALLV